MGLDSLLRAGKKISQGVACASALLVAVGCSDSKLNKDFKPACENEVAPYTQVLSKKELKKISSSEIGPNTNVIEFLEPTKLKEGEIMISGITDKAPYGMLKKVTGVSADGKSVYTENATLEEALEYASFEIEVSPPSGEYTRTDNQGNTITKKHKAGSLNFKDKQKLVYDLDGNLDTDYDKVHIEIENSFHSRFKLGVEIQKHKLKELSFRVNADASYSILVKTDESLQNINDEKRIAHYEFSPFVIGPLPGTLVPIVVYPEMDIYLSLRGSVSEVKTSIEQESEFSAGIIYNYRTGWRDEKHLSTDFDFKPPKRPKEFDLTACLRPEIHFLIYKMAGPQISAPVSLRVVDYSGTGSLTATLETSLGFNPGVFSKQIGGYNQVIFSEDKVLKKWD